MKIIAEYSCEEKNSCPFTISAYSNVARTLSHTALLPHSPKECQQYLQVPKTNKLHPGYVFIDFI